MKIDRRSFLSFVIGGAAGTAISPLPWKMTDDSSIWSQNWPWTPVPADGEYSTVNSVCTLCPGRCGITVRKVDDRAVKIEGMAGHPSNDGGICILGLSGLQLLYGPTRIQSPMKRTGKRGEGRWENISWEDAISEVSEKLQAIRQAGEPQAVTWISGTDTGTVSNLIGRLLTVYGSPNFIRTPSVEDTAELSLYLTQGAQGSMGYDLENSDFVISLGSGLLDGWGAPVRTFRAHSAWRDSGAKLIQVEPRLSNTAAKADKWIPIRPGTESVLALGLANVIIGDSLYNNFINDFTSGFEDWTDNSGTLHQGFKNFVTTHFNPDKVAGITGIDKSTIVSLAKSFASAAAPIAICGKGEGSIPGRLDEMMAVNALNALVGNLNQNGGLWAIPQPAYIDWPSVEMDGVASRGMQTERIDAAGSRQYPLARYLLNRLPEVLNSGAGDTVKALFISEANPIYALPEPAAVKKAFEKIPYIVSFSSFMDETALQADLLLPNHIYLERYQDVGTPSGLQQPVIGLCQPVVEPQHNTRHLGDVVIQIAGNLGGNMGIAFPWEDYQQCLEETLADQWDTLLEQGYWVDSQYSIAGWDTAFETGSGKFEFVPQGLDIQSDLSVEALYGKGVKQEGGKDPAYPLTLIPYDMMRISNGYVANPPFLVKSLADTVIKGKDSFVELNPKTAGELGLSEGTHALLSTPKGTAKVRIHLFEGIFPGVVAMPRGLGHSAWDPCLKGKGVNFNELVGSVEDPVSGMDTVWSTRASLRKA